MSQKIEVTHNNNAMTLDDDNTSEDVAIAWAREAGVTLSAEDLRAFMGVMQGWHASVQEFLASCRAKPVAEVSASNIERKRLGFALSNGQRR